MSTTLIWMLEGPMAGQFLEVPEEDAEQAEADGWAQKAAGRDSMGFKYPQAPGPHKKAEALLAKRQSGYATRELRPETNPAPEQPKAAAKQEPEKQETKTAAPKSETKTDEETATEEQPAAEETETKPTGKTTSKRK